MQPDPNQPLQIYHLGVHNAAGSGADVDVVGQHDNMMSKTDVQDRALSHTSNRHVATLRPHFSVEHRRAIGLFVDPARGRWAASGLDYRGEFSERLTDLLRAWRGALCKLHRDRLRVTFHPESNPYFPLLV